MAVQAHVGRPDDVRTLVARTVETYRRVVVDGGMHVAAGMG